MLSPTKGTLLFLFFLLSFSLTRAQQDSSSVDSTTASANSVRRAGVDSSLAKYSFITLSNAQIGQIYEVTVTPHFNGIKAEVVLLNSTMLASEGFRFNEVLIPPGVNFYSSSSSPVSSVLVALLYRKISNFTVYSLPPGYGFASPTVGIAVYLLLPNESEAALVFPPLQKNPIIFTLPSTANGNSSLCAYLGADGSVTLVNVTISPNICNSTNTGDDVSLVEWQSSSPPPASQTPNLPGIPLAIPANSVTSSPPSSSSQSWKAGLGVAFGVLGAMALILISVRLHAIERVKVAILERFGNCEDEVLMNTYLFKNIRAPSAASIRTRPTLESTCSSEMSDQG